MTGSRGVQEGPEFWLEKGVVLSADCRTTQPRAVTYLKRERERERIREILIESNVFSQGLGFHTWDRRRRIPKVIIPIRYLMLSVIVLERGE